MKTLDVFIFLILVNLVISPAFSAPLIHSPDSLPEVDKISSGTKTIPPSVFSKYDSDSIARAIVRLVQRRNHGVPAPGTFYVPGKYADRYFEYQLRMPTDALPGLIQDGHLGNLLQTGKSGGWAAIATRLNAEAPHWQLPFIPAGTNGTRDIREQIKSLGPVAEENILETLPNYGYITSPLAPSLIQQIPDHHFHYTHEVSRYGDVMLVLKPEARARMTYYPGDSLAAGNNDFFRAAQADSVGTINLNFKGRPWQAAPFLEFQLFGKLSLSDIAEIRIPPGFDSKSLALLKKTGIPVTEYDPSDWRNGYRRGRTILKGKFPLFPEPPPETEELKSEMQNRFSQFVSDYEKGPKYDALSKVTLSDPRVHALDLALHPLASPAEAKSKLMRYALAPKFFEATMNDLRSYSKSEKSTLLDSVITIAPSLDLTESQRSELFSWIHDNLPNDPNREKRFGEILRGYSERGGNPVGKLTPTGVRSTGSNDGFWVRDELGVKWLLKGDSVHPELQTSAEVISSGIYRALGYNVPVIRIVNFDNKRYAAVRSLGENLNLNVDLRKHDTALFRQMRIYAAYLKDWDRTVVGPNNADLENGEFASFDFGGTLGARARGEYKPGEVASPAIGSFEFWGSSSDEKKFDAADILGSYRIDHLPPDHPWRQITPQDVQEAIAKLERLRSSGELREIVGRAHYSNSDDEAYMNNALEDRANQLYHGAYKYFEQINGEAFRARPADCEKLILEGAVGEP